MTTLPRQPRRAALPAIIHATLMGAAAAFAPLHAGAMTVTSTADSGAGSLRAAFTAAADGDTIDFDCVALACPATITLSTQGNNQGFPGPTALSLKGRQLTIQGPPDGSLTLQAFPGGLSATSLRLFYIASDASLTLSNLTLSGGHAIGGSAVSGGGGGAGLGGAIFSEGTLGMSGVSIVNNVASGGHGGPGNTLAGHPFFWSGGGGLGGDGGYNAQGGGGGTGGDGTPRSNIANGQQGGMGGPGYGGTGGGIGGTYLYSAPGQSSAGTNGSNGGGGGNGLFNTGGNGSDGGGGGGGYAYGGGGDGGFGGGGGASAGNASGPAGNGGFGGGGAGGATPGQGGVGAGSGGTCIQAGNFFNCGGGGGAGLGGAVFARSGAVTLTGSGGLISGNQAIAGGAMDAGTGGAGAGAGLFLMSGVTTTIDVDGTSVIADAIGDDSLASLPIDSGFTPGPGIGASLVKQGTGTLVLSGNNTYGSNTIVSAGTVRVDGVIGSAIVDAGTLAGNGAAGAITLNAGGILAPGGSPGALSAVSVNWNGGGAMRFLLGTDAAGSDLLVLADALNHGNAGTFAFHFEQGWTAPTSGTTYTLVQAASTDFTADEFTFDFAPPLTALTGTFSIDNSAVKFTVGTVETDRLFGDGFD